MSKKRVSQKKTIKKTLSSETKESIIILNGLGNRRILITSSPKKYWKQLVLRTVPEDQQDLSETEKAFAWTYKDMDMFLDKSDEDTKIHVWMLFDEEVYSSFVTHEANHAVEGILDAGGIDKGKKDEELRSYLLDWIYGETCELAEKWGRIKWGKYPSKNINYLEKYLKTRLNEL
jgi:hypothetical protein